MTHRYFLDTEFLDNEYETTLISIAIVSDDDRELYLCNTTWLGEDGKPDGAKADDWLRTNVLPQLPSCACPTPSGKEIHIGGTDGVVKAVWSKAAPRFPHQPECRWRDPEDMRQLITEFIKDPGDNTKPEIWAYYASYDWYLFSKLFGRMINLPKHFPWLVNDLKTWATHIGFTGKFRDLLPDSGHHDALADAKWNRTAHYLVLQHMAVHDTLDENKRVIALVDKLLEDLNDRSGFALSSDDIKQIRPDWIKLISHGIQPRS